MNQKLSPNDLKMVAVIVYFFLQIQSKPKRRQETENDCEHVSKIVSKRRPKMFKKVSTINRNVSKMVPKTTKIKLKIWQKRRQNRCWNRCREKGRKMEAPAHRIGPYFRPKSLKNGIRNSTKKRYQKSIENRCQKVE